MRPLKVSASVVVPVMAAAVVLLGLYMHETRLRECERQIDESSAAFRSLALAEGANEGYAVILANTEYDVLHVDFVGRRAVLRWKNEDGKGFTIALGLEPEVMKRWHKYRHFRG